MTRNSLEQTKNMIMNIEQYRGDQEHDQERTVLSKEEGGSKINCKQK